MKKILRAALPLGMLALAFSTSNKAASITCPEYCDSVYNECIQACNTVPCVRQCANAYQECLLTC